MSLSQKKFLLGVAVLLLIVYFIFNGLQSSGAYYLTIKELKAGGTNQERRVRVSGLVVSGSIFWDSEKILLEFDLTEGRESLHVRYKGIRPNMLRDGAEAVVEGRYVGGIFEAEQILLKCPSKYEEENK